MHQKWDPEELAYESGWLGNLDLKLWTPFVTKWFTFCTTFNPHLITPYSLTCRVVNTTQPNRSIANRESFPCHTSIMATRFSRYSLCSTRVSTNTNLQGDVACGVVLEECRCLPFPMAACPPLNLPAMGEDAPDLLDCLPPSSECY